MGLYDWVKIEDGLDTGLPGYDGDPTEVEWQTKTFSRPQLDVYKITQNRRLYKEDAEYEVRPEDERPRYDEEIGGFESEWEKAAGMLEKTREGWSDTNYHGILEFHKSINGEGFAYEAKFTNGELVELERVNRW